MKRHLFVQFLFLGLTGLSIGTLTSCKESATNPGDTNPPMQTDVYWPSLAQSPWPMGQHDPQHTGRSPYVAAPSGALVKHISSGRVFGSPAFAENGTFYFAAADSQFGRHNLYAYSPDGILIWKCSIDSTRDMGGPWKAYSSPIVLKNGLIIVTSLDRALYAVNSNGIVAWMFNPPEHILTYGLNVGKDGTIYVTSANGTLYALSSSGSVLWSKLPSPSFGRGTSKIVISPDGNRIYTGAHPDGLYVLAPSGEILWYRPDIYSHENGVLMCDSDNNLYFATRDTLHCMMPTGELKWSVKIGGGIGSGAIDYQGNVAVSLLTIDSGYVIKNHVTSISPSGTRRWTTQIGFQYPENIIVDKEGTFYVGRGSVDGYYYAIRNDGTLKWRLTLPQIDVSSSPAIFSDGTLYLPSGSTTDGETFGIFMIR